MKSSTAATPLLPNFLIAGAAKCATTSLAFYLEEHPEILISEPKECHFFDDDALYSKGLGAYGRFFRHWTGERAIGDATPAYLHGEHIALRIKESLPGVRLIFLFRDPVKRAYSSYWHAFNKGRPIGSFAESIDDPTCRHIWEQSRYARYISIYLKHFSRDQMRWIITEQLGAEPESVLRETFEFLGVDPSFHCTRAGKKRNPRRSPRSIRIQRMIYRLTPSQRSPEEQNTFDQSGMLHRHHQRKPLERVVSPALRVLTLLNTSPQEKTPALDPAVADRVSAMYREDNRRLADLTGLDLARWWSYF